MLKEIQNEKTEWLETWGLLDNWSLSEETFDATMARCEAETPVFLQDAWFDTLQEDFQIFSEKEAFVRAELKRVREHEYFSKLAALIGQLLAENEPGAHFSYPKLKSIEDQEFATDRDMAIYFAQLSRAYDIAEYHRAHGVPEDVVRATLWHCFERGIVSHAQNHGQDGFCDYGWNEYFLNYNLLRIGVFNFELKRRFTDSVRVFRKDSGEIRILVNNRDVARDGQMSGSQGHDEVLFHASITETEETVVGYPVDTENAKVQSETVCLNKSEWKESVVAGDTVVGVHIPSGVQFTVENMEASYRRCVEIMRRCYPEIPLKAFACFSWMMDPQLKGLLKPTSNILAFQSRFARFPQKSSGIPALASVFHRYDPPYEDFPENSSLQRNMKALYLSGGCIYMQGAIMFDFIEER